MARTRNSTSKALLSVAAAIFSISAMGAEPAPSTPATTPAASTTPATPLPEPPKPFSDIDPATKPKPIEINPRDLPAQQPASIKSAQ